MMNNINWTNVLIVLGILAVLSLVFTVIILIINKFCAVKTDPKIEQVSENLAGANCGGCGFAGCADFAKALVEGRANINACAATANSNKEVIATILGQEVTESEPMMAVVHCRGNSENTTKKFNYVGIPSCEAKNVFHGGDKLCINGCLGEGGCKLVCNFNAMNVNNNVANVDSSNCSACGTCIKACPKHIIGLIPKSAKVYVACSNECKGKDVINACKVGCIGCGLCAKSCPGGAIEMVNNLPVIDYTKCTGCGLCADKCPQKSIVKVK